MYQIWSNCVFIKLVIKLVSTDIFGPFKPWLSNSSIIYPTNLSGGYFCNYITPSVLKINALRSWTPTLEIKLNTKISKGLCTAKWTNKGTHCTSTQVILPRGMWPHALHKITVHANDRQKSMCTTGQRDIDTDIQDWLDPTEVLWAPV